MFLNRNTNYTASSVAIQNKSRTLLNNSIVNRKIPKENPSEESDISNCENQCITIREPMSQNNFREELQVKKRQRLPKFLDIIYPTIFKTYNTILYSDVIGANYTSYYSFLASDLGASLSITSNYIGQGSPSNFTMFLSNLQPQTGYSVVMQAFNNFGQATYTLPTVITNIAPPVFPPELEILHTVTYNSIAFLNILGASNIVNASEYFITITNSGFPVTTITSNITLQYVADGSPSNVRVELFNLRSLTTYFTTLFASNISGCTSIKLPYVKTTASNQSIAPPSFDSLTGYTFSSEYNSITFTDIRGASNIETSSQYSIELSNESGPIGGYTSEIFLTYCNVGEPSNVTITLGDLTPLTTYFTTLIARNASGAASNILSNVTTLIAPPSFDTLTGYTVLNSSNTIRFLNIRGASNIERAEQYSVILSNTSGPLNNSEFESKISLNYFDVGLPSNVTISLNRLAPLTAYFTTLVASNVSGTASNILISVQTT